MPTFIRKWLGPTMGLLLCLAAAPAFAGEWVKGVSDREGWNAIGYRGNFYEGEFATLYYTRLGEKKFSGDSREQLYRLGMLLNNGDANATIKTQNDFFTVEFLEGRDVPLRQPQMRAY